ncbi:pectate lyase a [Moniliophthora roreri MCA 2997]|uniref:Pectate lyase a n=1 Tax=Moniliophthora roreri (strain MCA 2997) TaxID=1381753 RepID=V2X9K7_MONRO|nr:pectate lyase a [Moniliophthora roreri MCA 2997]
MTRFTFCLLLLSLFTSFTTAQDGYASQNGGTTGGKGGTTTTVSAAGAFQTAIKSDTPKTVYLKGPITLSSQAQIGNNTSIIGVGTTGIINGGGLEIDRKSNVIIRNLVINKVVGDDGITIQHGAHNIWIDHNEFYSDLNHGFDYYDGQVDITHASDYVTVSYNYFHDHYKSSLVGGDPDGGKEGE